MRITARDYGEAVSRLHRREWAFTLSEFMVTMAIFIILVGGLVMGHNFGLRLLMATEDVSMDADSNRILLQRITDEIVSSCDWKLGSGNATTFTELQNGLRQQANAVQVYPTYSTNQYSRIYLDKEDNKLKRVTESVLTPRILAQSITNDLIFSYETTTGTVISNRIHYAVLALNLQFQDLKTNVYGLRTRHGSHELRARFALRAGD